MKTANCKVFEPIDYDEEISDLRKDVAAFLTELGPTRVISVTGGFFYRQGWGALLGNVNVWYWESEDERQG